MKPAMGKSFHVEFITPDKTVFEGEATAVVLPAEGGSRTLVDEWIEAGTTFRKLVFLDLGESIDVKIDGK